MRILIYGAGAIGSDLGALLTASGEEVTLLARGAQLAALKSAGVTIERKGKAPQQVPVQAASAEACRGPYDLIFVTLKSTQLEDAAADIHAMGLVPRDGAYHYDVRAWGRPLGGFTLPMGGRHNVENSLAAIAVALRLGLSDAAVRAALTDFRGVRRRFEFHHRLPGRAYIDDYAHHPEELRALIEGVRDLYPGSRLTLVFQPHLFSRTRDFAGDFAGSLDGADEVLLLPVYPAREEPIAGVDAHLISAAMRRGAVHVADGAEVLRWLEAHPPEVLVTAGAGDIDRLVEPIREYIGKRTHG